MRTSAKKLTTLTTAVVLAVSATFTLSGCFSNPIEGLIKGGASDVIKNATGADIDLGGKSIPKGFPSEVPLVEGEVEYGASMTSEGATIWTVRILVDDPNIFEKIQSQMAKAGMEETFSTTGETQMGSFGGNGYGAVVSVDQIDGKVGVSYVVSPIEDE